MLDMAALLGVRWLFGQVFSLPKLSVIAPAKWSACVDMKVDMRTIRTVCADVCAHIHRTMLGYIHSQVTPMLPQTAQAGDRWYVTNGVVAVGPLEFELLTRGVARGRIPNGSLVRHESWKVWRPFEDIGALTDDARDRVVAHFGNLSASIDERASGPGSVPPPPPDDVALEDEPESSGMRSSYHGLRPVAVDPVGVLSSAATLEEALLLALSTSVTAAGAEVGLLHRVHRELGGAVTEFGHGPHVELLLGEKLLDSDPTLAAARSGCTVVAEPRPGDVGRYLAGRLGRCISSPRGLAMVPVLMFDELVGMLEIGRSGRPFRARELARVEDVVESLSARIVVAGWLE